MRIRKFNEDLESERLDLEFVKEYKIKPLLKEYFYGNSEKLNEILNMVDDRKSK